MSTTGGCITDPFIYLVAGLLVGQSSMGAAWLLRSWWRNRFG